MKMKVNRIMDKTMLSAYQRKLLRAAAMFCAVFLVCFLISRGIYSAGLPQVTTEYGMLMKLGHTVEAEGKVVGNREIAVAAEPNLLIASLLVEVGQQVEPGIPLLQIDMEDLNEKIGKQETEIKKLELQIQAIRENESISAGQKETDKKRADEDYENAKAKADGNIGKAQNDLEHVKNALNDLGGKEEYVKWQKEQDAGLLALKENVDNLEKEYRKMKEDGADKADIKSKKEALEEAKKAANDYEKQLEQTLAMEWETKKGQLEQDVASGENAVQAAWEEGESSLNAAARGMEDARAESASDSSLAVAEIELEELKRQLKRYQELKEAGGTISAPGEGDIMRINAASGDMTGETAVLTMTDKTEGYRFLADITKEEKKYVELQDTATVQLVNGMTLDMTIDAMEEDGESGLYHISGLLDQNVKLGDGGSMIVQKSGKEEYFCVPLQAVHGDGINYYILVAESRQTILGEQLYAVKYPVTIVDQNDKYAAIKGSVSKEQPIIVTSTKIVYEGDTVRLLEN